MRLALEPRSGPAAGLTVLIWQLAYQRPPAETDGDRSVGAAVRQYLDGLRYLRQQPDFLAIASHKAAFSLVISGAFQVR